MIRVLFRLFVIIKQTRCLTAKHQNYLMDQNSYVKLPEKKCLLYKISQNINDIPCFSCLIFNHNCKNVIRSQKYLLRR